MAIWKTVVGKLWLTIIGLVGIVICTVGFFLLLYIDLTFADPVKIERMFMFTGAVGFLLTTFFAFFLVTKITQPLREMIQAANRIARGEYSVRLTYRSSDEIGELSGALNMMAAELDKLIRDLQHERDHLSGVLRSMSDAVITFDAGGNVIMTNPKGENLLEAWNAVMWEEEEEGESSIECRKVPGPLREPFRTVIREKRELTAKLNVKNEVWSVVMTPLAGEDGVRGAVAVFRNVTEEFRTEKMRRDFVANVSHELRTPLSMLQGYSEALLDDIAATPEERKELARVIHEESMRMSRLVQDLLDLAKMEAGHVELIFRRVNVGELLVRVHRKYAAMAKERGIRLECAVPEEDLVLEQADDGRLEQVLANLLSNAFRHTPAGKAIRLAARKTAMHRGEAVELEVADEGSGIPEEDLPYIFERFYKADKSRKRERDGGTGLGLAIVRHLVEAHGGEIGVRSKVGQGTTFTVRLPAGRKKGRPSAS
ncbi:MAG: histidine kinase [Paenibacillaceae bacterium ZCTH02-B3]|nr:MAG: histidine kinase [Paenibacillaceae bacterium ZCTH02-B3]